MIAMLAAVAADSYCKEDDDGATARARPADAQANHHDAAAGRERTGRRTVLDAHDDAAAIRSRCGPCRLRCFRAHGSVRPILSAARLEKLTPRGWPLDRAPKSRVVRQPMGGSCRGSRFARRGVSKDSPADKAQAWRAEPRRFPEKLLGRCKPIMAVKESDALRELGSCNGKACWPRDPSAAGLPLNSCSPEKAARKRSLARTIERAQSRSERSPAMSAGQSGVRIRAAAGRGSMSGANFAS